MPYVSDAQRRYFNANRKKLRRQGVDVDEWNAASRGKKLPERVKPMSKAAEFGAALGKLAAAGVPSNEIVDMQGLGGTLADYVTPGTWGGERAGRIQSMAAAVGEPTTFGVRHPVTADFLGGLGGALAGGGLGAAAGAGAGALVDRLLGTSGLAMGGGIGGGLAGALGGSLLGKLLSAGMRRREMSRITRKYDEARGAGSVRPQRPEFSQLAAIFAPGRGPHRTGQLEGYRAMLDPGARVGSRTRNMLYAMPALLGPASTRLDDTGNTARALSALISTTHGYGQNIRTQMADDDRPSRRSEAEDAEPRSKAAAFGASLGRMLATL